MAIRPTKLKNSLPAVSSPNSPSCNPESGLFDSKRFRYFLRRHLRAKTFEELKTPLVVVATDLDNGESHEFRSGPIVEAVTASCSIPIIFSPVVINGVHYVDGGLFHNFPVSIIREECERIIGVNVSPLVPQKYKQTIFHIAERSYTICSGQTRWRTARCAMS